MQDLARLLKTYMDEQHLTLRDMEQRSGVSRSLLHSLIHGRETEPKLATLKGIAQAVEVPLWRVIELAGVDLELPQELSYDAERLSLMVNKSQLLQRLLPQMLAVDEKKLSAILNFIASPDDAQIYHIRMAFIDERYTQLTEGLLALAPVLLEDIPPRYNIYEGRRIDNRSEGGGLRALVTVNGQSLTELLPWEQQLEWGYAGKGPNELASALLRYEYGHAIEAKFAPSFFRTVTMALPRDYARLGIIWQLDSQQLDLWLILMRLREQVQTRGEPDRT
jgi:transcriptional regulator with XRE-family HTH domain